MTYTNIEGKEKIPELILKYEFALDILETQLNILIKEFAFLHGYNPVEHIKSRMKEEESAIQKLKQNG